MLAQGKENKFYISFFLTKDTSTSPKHTFLISAAMSNYQVEQGSELCLRSGVHLGRLRMLQLDFTLTDLGFFFKNEIENDKNK